MEREMEREGKIVGIEFIMLINEAPVFTQRGEGEIDSGRERGQKTGVADRRKVKRGRTLHYCHFPKHQKTVQNR